MKLTSILPFGKSKKDNSEKHGPIEEVVRVAPSVHSSAGSSISFGETIKHEIMCNFIYQQQCTRRWIQDDAAYDQGALVRRAPGDYIGVPSTLRESQFALMCKALNVQCAMTVKSKVVDLFLACSEGASSVPLHNGLRVQILTCMTELARARKHQFAAFIASGSMFVVWDDDASNIIARAKAIEAELVSLVWEPETAKISEKSTTVSIQELNADAGEEGAFGTDRRRRNLMSAVQVGLSIFVIVVVVGVGLGKIAQEIVLDGNYMRCAILLVLPMQVFFSLFFAQVIMSFLLQLVGPVKHIHENSHSYSGKAPPRLTDTLPHVTIQMPVYKESLATVIGPTIKSVKRAISTYELQGGTANLFVNDDGMQIISEEDRNARLIFYNDNNIGWTARPKHNAKPAESEKVFLRRGRFKKASNMNYGLMITNKIEDKLCTVERSENWAQVNETREYERCLKEVLDETEGALAAGNIRVGDYILLLDCDTRVPSDCLLDGVSELELSPEVAILQFASGVMQVANNYFENGIAYFTHLVYTAIGFAVANGDVAPFVGHNAMLRWSAIQQQAYTDDDGYEKFWSESHVSEDFDMALRLQIDDYVIRYATWAGDGFKEGVSLTVYDELNRWEKYAYGCNELLFHPIRYWIFRGPFTPLFRKFLFSNLKFPAKLTILGYIGTYYAIGSAWVTTLVNYFLVGWYNGYIDKYYLNSYHVWFALVIVFSGLATVSLAVFRYRAGVRTFFGALAENFCWLIMFMIFFGGISLHVSQALLCHMFSINMTWGSTSKELESSNFFKEVPKLLTRFKGSVIFSLTVLVGIVVLATASFIPYSWNIDKFVAILPLSMVAGCHLLVPIALNPALMTFSW